MKPEQNIKPFICIEDAFVITISKGVERQVALYKRQKKLFAKQCGGFIKLMNDGQTSHRDVKWRGLAGVEFIILPTFWKQVEVAK